MALSFRSIQVADDAGEPLAGWLVMKGGALAAVLSDVGGEVMLRKGFVRPLDTTWGVTWTTLDAAKADIREALEAGKWLD